MRFVKDIPASSSSACFKVSWRFLFFSFLFWIFFRRSFICMSAMVAATSTRVYVCGVQDPGWRRYSQCLNKNVKVPIYVIQILRVVDVVVDVVIVVQGFIDLRKAINNQNEHLTRYNIHFQDKIKTLARYCHWLEVEFVHSAGHHVQITTMFGQNMHDFN